MEAILKKACKVAKEAKEYLIAHLDDLKYCESKEHYVEYLFSVGEEDYEVKIWIANGEKYAMFYESISFFDFDDIGYTDEERAKLWAKAQADKANNGEVRNIKVTQLSNDLFFSFQGVFGEVKFTGYDDHDWWTKHKPTEVRETDEITWQIDLDKRTAIYKPRQIQTS